MTSFLFKRERLLGLVPYAFVAVPLAYMTLFVFGPLIQQVWMSFTDCPSSEFLGQFSA